MSADNGIAISFPKIPSRYVALFLSFLIGGSIVCFSEIKGTSPVLKKTVFWVLNSLVIFALKFGTRNLAADATGGTSKDDMPQGQLLPLVSTVFAQKNSSQAAPPSAGPEQNEATTSSSSNSRSIKFLNGRYVR